MASGEGRVADHGMPLLDMELACHDARAHPMSVLDDLERVAAILGAELGEAEVVDDQDLGLG